MLVKLVICTMQANLSYTKWQLMTIKISLYIIFISLFFTGCSHTLVNTKQLENLDTKITSLEEKLSQELSTNMANELDIRLKQYDEDIKLMLQNSIEEQKQQYESLKNELSILMKPQIQEIQKENRTKQRSQVIYAKKTTSIKDKLIVGRVEKVHIYPSDLVMNARIDTGAETSSIDARDITEFERDGKNWVRFTLIDRKANSSHVIERKVVRTAKILQSSQEDGHEKRVVVTLKISIGDRSELSEFTLTNREHMTYPILIGRNALLDVMIVDVSKKYIAPIVQEKDKGFKK